MKNTGNTERATKRATKNATKDELRKSISDLREYSEATFEYWDKDMDHKVGKRLQAMAGKLKGYDKAVDEALSHIQTEAPDE